MTSSHEHRPDGGPHADARRPRAIAVLADRTAVLVVGLCTGFAVGLSFAAHGSNDAIVPPVVVPATGGPVSAGSPPAPAAALNSGAIDPRVARRVARDGVVRVGVFGDSYAVGVWSALYHLLPAASGFDVLQFGKESTGFTRYRVLNIDEHARRQIAARPIDVAVVSIGVNDAQDIYEGHLFPFMSADWQRIVGERVDRLIDTLRSTGAVVIWVGLPAMRDPALDAKVRAINDLFAARAARSGVRFIDTRPLSVDGRGQYASHLPDRPNGDPRLIRTGDGVHMIGIGYQRIVAAAVADIESYADRARAAAKVDAPAPAGPRP